MTATMAPTTVEREQYRATTRELRGNAGIDNREQRERIEAVADFGAAARRLRASVRGGAGYAGDGVVRRPVSAATRRAADGSRAEAAADRAVIDLANAAGVEAASPSDEDARAQHPTNKARRFRLRALA